MNPTLCAVIITKNEAKKIRDCLESLKWLDEIIVIDSGSTDGTQAICREYTEKVFEMDWPGFGKQKRRAVEKATCDWILSIDADERVSEELKHEIMQAISNKSINGYEIPRLSYYCGQAILRGGWRPDYVMRLFRRGYGQFNDVPVHEKLEVRGNVARLNSTLIHYPFDNLEEVLDKINLYSSLAAKATHEKNRKCTIYSAFTRGSWAFFRTYLLQGSILDGKKGLMLAISNAEGTYYKYLKLMLLCEESCQKKG